jgi:hypothetical protein
MPFHLSDGWTCIGCGCTNERACAGGCYWVDQDKCSGCFDDSGERFAVGGRGWQPVRRRALPGLRNPGAARADLCRRHHLLLRALQDGSRGVSDERTILSACVTSATNLTPLIVAAASRRAHSSKPLADRQRFLNAAINSTVLLLEELKLQQHAARLARGRGMTAVRWA